METSDDLYLTVRLTGRRPVKLLKADWPVIAVGEHHDHDGQVRCQANRTWDTWIRVRRHADGRAIVYGRYSFSSNWEKERDVLCSVGCMLDAIDGINFEMIAATIQKVGEQLAEAGSERARVVIRACLANLPPEEV